MQIHEISTSDYGVEKIKVEKYIQILKIIIPIPFYLGIN